MIEKFDFDAAPVLALVVSGRRSAREITELADKRIKRALEGVKDIGAVTLGRPAQARDPDRGRSEPPRPPTGCRSSSSRRRSRGRTWRSPAGASRARGARRGSGRSAAWPRWPTSRPSWSPRRARGPVRVRDVAQVLDAEEEPRTLSRLDGNNAVSLLVRKQSGTNTVAVVDRVKARLGELRATLPPDVTIDVVRDQSRFIKRALGEVQHHLVLGALLASLIVWVFLGWRNWRPALIAAVSIPTSIIATFFAMRWAGFTLNNVTMLGLSVSTGIVIDDAIIVLENIFRHMDEEKRSPWEAAVTGSKEIVARGRGDHGLAHRDLLPGGLHGRAGRPLLAELRPHGELRDPRLAPRRLHARPHARGPHAPPPPGRARRARGRPAGRLRADRGGVRGAPPREPAASAPGGRRRPSCWSPAPSSSRGGSRPTSSWPTTCRSSRWCSRRRRAPRSSSRTRSLAGSRRSSARSPRCSTSSRTSGSGAGCSPTSPMCRSTSGSSTSPSGPGASSTSCRRSGSASAPTRSSGRASSR